ncbi:MAG: LysR family transcriptional regulator [Bdellovibrionales bacterium]|nr:LysR family transcriptional regulator [Bdellovibrionales bacterium]
MEDLDSLRTFAALADTLSFREAARRLGISQPSVTRHLQWLESELGADLVLRDRHQVRLTAVGKELKGRTSPLLEELARTLKETREGQRTMSGPISMGCLAEIGQSLFARLLGEFRARHPLVEVRIELFDEDREIAEGVREGRLDFGVCSTPVLTESSRSYPLLEENAVLVTRASNPAKGLPEPDSAAFVGYTDHDPLLERFLQKHLASRKARAIRRLSTANSHRAMIELLTATDGYAVLPHFSVRAAIEEGRLRIASDKSLKGTLYLLQPERAHVPDRFKALAAHLRARCKEEGNRG